MAKILLNVDLKTKEAIDSVNKLKGSIEVLSKSFEGVKVNKDLTAQIQSLTKYYKELTTAASKVSVASAKIAQDDLKAAKAKQQLAEATSKAVVAEEKAAQAHEKTTQEAAKTLKAAQDLAAAAARREKAEIATAEAAEKHAAAEEKRAEAASKAASEDEEEEGKLYSLEKAYAALVVKIQDTAEKVPTASDSLGKLGEEARGAWEEIRAFNNDKGALSSSTAELKENYDRLSASVASYVAEQKEASQEILSSQKGMEEWTKSVDTAEKQAQTLETQLYNLLKRISNEENRYDNGVFDGLKDKIRGVIEETESLDKTDANYVTRVKELQKETAGVVGELSKVEATASHAAPAVSTLGEKFGNLIERYAKFYASSLLVRKPLEMIKNALDEVGETLVKTEDAVIEIRRILENPESAETISSRIYDLAYQYGQTFENVSEIVSNFARTGRDFNESIEATEAALLAMNVAELNATQASEGLISILAQFKKEPEELVKVVDQLNKAADKNPVTTGKLLTALQRTGSSAANANLNLERTVGIITSLSEATNRSGQNLGTAVNSLIQYSTKAESLDLFAKLSDSARKAVEDYRVGAADILDVWSAVSDEINRLQNESVEKQNELFEMFNSEEVEELSSSLHDELGDIFEQIGGVYDIANTYRKNYFIALLANMDRVFKVEQEISDAEGYSRKENTQYMETYTAKVNQLNAAWQKLANDEQGILGLKKSLVEIGIGIVNFVENSGGIVTTVTEIAAGVGGLVLTLKSAKIAEGILSARDGLKLTKDALKNVITNIYAAKTAEDAATASAVAWQGALGWIGVAMMAITALVGAVNRYNTAQKEAREEAIATWKEHEEQTNKIEKLLGKLNELNQDSEEYRETESKLVELLGDKKTLLEGLTAGTEEYTEKVKELTRAQLEQYRMDADRAKKAAEDKLLEQNDHWFSSDKGKFYQAAAQNLGKGFEYAIGFSDLSLDEILDYYDKLSAKQEDLSHRYSVYLAEGNEYASTILEMSTENQKLLDAVAEDIKTYRDAAAESDRITQLLNGSTNELAKNAEKAAESLNDAARASKEAVASLGPEPTGAKDTASIFDSLTRAAKEYVKDLETVHDAQKEYAENGKVSASTMEKLLLLGDAYRNAIFDETGKLDLNSEALQKLNKDRENFLTAHGYVVPALEEETEKVDENTEAINKELNAVDKKIKFATQYKNEIETVNKAQAEYTATGKLSAQTIHDLLSLDEKLVDLMRDENGQLNVNSERLAKVLKIRENYVLNQGMVIENTKEEIKLLDEELDKLKDTISLRKSELTIYEKSGVSMGEREAKMREIIADIGDEIAYLERTQEIVDGVGSKQEEINRLKAEQLDYEEKIASMYEKSAEEQKKLLEEQQKAAEKAAKEAEQAEKERLKAIEDAQKAQIAAYDAEINLYNSKISLSEAENGTVEERVGYYEQIKEILQEKIEYLEILGGREAEINELKVDQYEIEEKIAKLKEDEIERLQQEELAVITDEIDLLESRLKIAEQTYGAEAERISILASINALLGQQIQYLISIGATELEINKIKSEQLGIQAQILALEQQSLMLVQNAELGAIQDELDALLNGVEIEEKSLDLTEQQIDLEKDRSAELKKAAELEEQIAKAKLEYIESVIDAYMKSEKSADSLAEKQEAVQNAREKLEQARRDSVAKALEAAYKKQNDSASDALDLEEKRLAVEKARVALTAAENDKTVRVYNEESGEWERQADAKKVQDAKEAFNDAVRALNDFVEEQAWDEVIAAVENGSISGSRMNAILDKWAAANYGEGTPEFIAKIKSVYKQSLGHIDEDDSVIGAEKNVEKAVKSLNDYLKSEAINELKEYLEAGNRDTEGMNAILDKWMGLGEGGEMYTWRTGLLDVVTEAIESNYYDDSKIRSQIEDTSSKIKETTTAVHGTTAEVKKLNTTFVTEIRKAAKDSSEAVAAVIAKYQDSVDQRLIQWAEEVADKVQEIEDKKSYMYDKNENGRTQAEIDDFVARMKANSAEWLKAQSIEDEQLRKDIQDALHNENLAYAALLGLDPEKNYKDGHWYDNNGNLLYDKGGVLRGLGGIKATERPEIVLDPNLTEKILRPNSEAQFRAFADALGLIFEHGDRIGASSKPIINGQRYSDSHNVSTVINGVPIPSHVADNYTIAELARMIPAV